MITDRTTGAWRTAYPGIEDEKDSEQLLIVLLFNSYRLMG